MFRILVIYYRYIQSIAYFVGFVKRIFRVLVRNSEADSLGPSSVLSPTLWVAADCAKIWLEERSKDLVMARFHRKSPAHLDDQVPTASDRKIGGVSMQLIARDDVQPFIGDDKSIIRELASPGNSGLAQHSVAEIRHPPGTASLEHYHTEAEEVYFVLEGRGGIRVDGETHTIGPGDVVVITPGERHKVWQEGKGDLVLLVTCVPAYSVEQVVFTE